MQFHYNDGGRAAAGYKGVVGDCFVRALTIAGQYDYQEIYDLVNSMAVGERRGKRKRYVSSARNGVYRICQRKVMNHLDWTWVPTMFIGSGCNIHLRDTELPSGRLVVCISRHFVAVINGVINDLDNCSRDGSRCVYGYYVKE
jgi:hypothetical protein